MSHISSWLKVCTLVISIALSIIFLIQNSFIYFLRAFSSFYSHYWVSPLPTPAAPISPLHYWWWGSLRPFLPQLLTRQRHRKGMQTPEGPGNRADCRSTEFLSWLGLAAEHSPIVFGRCWCLCCIINVVNICRPQTITDFTQRKHRFMWILPWPPNKSIYLRADPSQECACETMLFICLGTFIATSKNVWLIYINFTVLPREGQITWKI